MSEAYFFNVGLPLLAEKFPWFKEKIAAGLVGEGSECLGFDDDLSRDHDWGPSFCLWLTEGDFYKIGPELQKAYNSLPAEFAGVKPRQESSWGSGRTGVLEIGQFYKRFIGFDHPPQDLIEWRVIPEENLAAATNGSVFWDQLGEFSRFREKLKAFYPEDIRVKKIASRCMTMAQAGQYNFLRSLKRKEWVAAQYAETEFIGAAISMIFLLNKVYKPFYKWMHKALVDLPILGNPIHRLISDLVAPYAGENRKVQTDRKINLIEMICEAVIHELKKQGLSDSNSDFLLDHGPLVQEKIQDPRIRCMNVWIG